MKDQTLTELLTNKFPKIEGFKCESWPLASLYNGTISIQFMNCTSQELPAIRDALKAFVDESNFAISAPSVSPFEGKPYVLVQLSSTERDKLVAGLSIAQNVPELASTKLVMRC